MKFLIQTIDKRIVHDFSFQLIQNIEFWNWFANENIEYKRVEDVRKSTDKYIPCGSVEFVSDYLEKHFHKRPKPRNVPEELFPFANRRIFNGTEKNIRPVHVIKSNDKIKDKVWFVSEKTILPPGNYQISEQIEIDSEWRAFVYQGKLVGLQNYSGLFTIFPNLSQISQMINAFKSAPIAYTIDVGIYENNTFVIEVHDFFSVGLYGFQGKDLMFMFSGWFYEFIRS